MLSRRHFLGTLAAAPALAQTRKPNIVFLFSDDHHWQCLGVAGNPKIQTPNLDKLASRGVYFRQTLISTAQCAPSRGIMLSGQEIYQTGLDNNGDHTAYRFFKGSTIVEQLRKAGYATNLVGKWHITNSPKECGFEKAPLWMQAGASKYIDPVLTRGIDGKPAPVTGHITELWTDAALEVIRSAGDKPYLLWLAYNAPHTPWSAGEKYQQMYAGKNAELAPPMHPKPPAGMKGKPYDWETYYAVISELDAHIGRVVDTLEKSGQWNNTLVVFLGDNGFLAGSKGLSGKVHAWEESIRVPMILSGGVVPRRGVSDACVASVDVPATMLDYAGVQSSHKLAGSSLRPLLGGSGKFPRDAAFVNWVDGRAEALTVRTAVEPYRVARTPEYKYILWESKKEALFDLRKDPHEEKNLAADAGSAAELKRMKDKLRARMKDTSDPAISWL